MMKFRKKPVVIEAIQWDGDNIEEIKKFTQGKAIFESRIGGSEDGESYPQKYDRLVIPTLEGNHLAIVGDWIIKGIKGEFYPCKAEIFGATYEQVSEAE